MPRPEWYRAWRHEERARDQRLAINARADRIDRAKRIIGDLMLLGAIMAFAWASMPG